MIITWQGGTSFTIKSKHADLVINPLKELTNPPKMANVVLSSKEGDEIVEFEGSPKVFDWPGEYETREIPIVALPGWDKSLSKEEGGQKGTPVNIFKFEIEGISFCHLGDIGHVLKSDMVEELGDIDVLFLPAGDKCALPAKKAHEIVEQIDPRMVILMGDGSFQEFLKEGGVKEKSEEKLQLTSKSQFQEDRTEFVTLEIT